MSANDGLCDLKMKEASQRLSSCTDLKRVAFVQGVYHNRQKNQTGSVHAFEKFCPMAMKMLGQVQRKEINGY